nr:hypothetical protein [Tanacetum cinerariifolium]
VSASESAFAEEPVQTISQMNEPSYSVFETGADDQTIVQSFQHPEWFSQPKNLQLQIENFDPVPRTPEDSEDDGNCEEDQGLRISEEERLNEEEEADELYQDDIYTKHRHSATCGRSSLGVESYQKRLNLTKPDTYWSDLKRREAYTAYSNPRGFIYQNKDKKNRLMRIDELHKFSDGTHNDVRNALDDHLKGIRMQYLP